MKAKSKLAFIGCGNIASAMIKGITGKNINDGGNIYVYDRHRDKLEKIKKECGVSIAESLLSAAGNADIVFVCVEPSGVGEVAGEIKECVRGKVVVSCAAGVSVQTLKDFFYQDTKVVRIMPNLPMTVGEGCTMICRSDDIGGAELEEITSLISSFGAAKVMDEKYINAFTALAGSSPAMIFMLIEAMADAGVYMGMNRAQAYEIASKAVEGSAKMISETGLAPSQLKDRVCSPAGTTIEMYASLESSAFRSAVMDSLIVCGEKCEKLSKK